MTFFLYLDCPMYKTQHFLFFGPASKDCVSMYQAL